MRAACYVVKLGGSITTKKQGRYELRHEVIAFIAEVLQSRAASLDVPLILVLGGGSYGNLAPTDYRIFERDEGLPSVDLPMMTVTMFAMLSEISNVCVDHALRVYPLQTSALCSAAECGRLTMDTRSLRAVMAAGYIPLLSGDLVIGQGREPLLLSSDDIPALLTEDFDVRRVLYYTDVSGIYDPADPSTIIAFVSSANASDVQGLVGGSAATDLTGGMRNKFMQQRLLAQRGVESEVLAFEHFHHLDQSLRGTRQFGTVFLSE